MIIETLTDFGPLSSLISVVSILLPVAIIADLAAGTVGGLANLLFPEGEDIKSFDQFGGDSELYRQTGVSLHPADILAQFMGGMGSYGKYMTERATQPFQFSDSARVQSPHYYAGGGLPFNVGVSGVDQGYYPERGYAPDYGTDWENKSKQTSKGLFGGYGDIWDPDKGEYLPPDNEDTKGGNGGPRENRVASTTAGSAARGAVAAPTIMANGPTVSTAAKRISGLPASADPGPTPTGGDFRNMLSALRKVRGIA